LSLLRAVLRLLAAWIERLNLTQWKRDREERRARVEDANRRTDEMAEALARGDLATVERLQRMRDRSAVERPSGDRPR